MEIISVRLDMEASGFVYCGKQYNTKNKKLYEQKMALSEMI